MQRPLEEQLEHAKNSLIRWKTKYRKLRNFMINKGVPTAYFDEYNALFNKEFQYDREGILRDDNTSSKEHT